MDESQVRSSMQRAVDLLLTDIASIRTGRATPGLVDSLEVSVYGGQSRMKLREIASITAPDSNMLVIEPWDKSIIGDIRKGILEANVGFNPSIDGEQIRIVIPAMTAEDREKYVKLLSTKLENTRVGIRQVRGDAMHAIKKAFEEKEIAEDERRGKEKKIQELTDLFVAKIEEIGENKKKELLTI